MVHITPVMSGYAATNASASRYGGVVAAHSSRACTGYAPAAA